MSKYSSGEYAPGPHTTFPHLTHLNSVLLLVYHDAINHWALVAIIVSLRIELRNLYLKCQRGLLDMPTGDTLNDWFFHQALEALPLQLKRNYQLNSHNNSRYYHRKKSSDPEEQISLLLGDVKSYLTFEDEEVEGGLAQATRNELQIFLYQSVKLIDQRLMRELDEVSEID
jgi:hypothetical protein